MKTKTILKTLMITAFVSAFAACSKDNNNNNPDPIPTPTPTPADTRELVVKAQFVNKDQTGGGQDTLVDIPNLKITLGGNNSPLSALMGYNESNQYTKTADATGVAKFAYTELNSYSIGASDQIRFLAFNSPYYGAYNGSTFLESSAFSFDDRNTYSTFNIPVRAQMWQYMASFSKWNLFYASVNGVVVDITTTCNNDDYVKFEIGTFGAYYYGNGYARLTYFDGANTCGGFPATNPYIVYNHQTLNGGNDGNPALNARYNTTTNALELLNSGGNNIGNLFADVYTYQSFFGLYPNLHLESLNTLVLTTTDSNTGYTVVKKFVAVP